MEDSAAPVEVPVVFALPPAKSEEVVQCATANFKVAVVHEEMNPRRRCTMEDVHRLVPHLGDLHMYSYFGVYDGHGGRQIAEFLEESLEKNIELELKHPDGADVKERLMRAFLITDMHSRKQDIVTSGATVVSALIKSHEDDASGSGSRGRTLYVANCGDSRAVLAVDRPQSETKSGTSESGYYAWRLSHDHRPEDESEQKRIKEAGGFFMRGRVLGILAVTRSFGDHGMKEFVTAVPYITETDLGTVGDAPFLILACDGVWDVLSDQEAVDLVLAGCKENQGPDTEAAKKLVMTAMERGSGDNITAIVVFL